MNTLQSGQQAPDFTTTDINNNTIQLSAYKDKKILLAFLRYAGCPFCNLILKNIIKQLKSLDKENIQILVFFQSPHEHVKSYPGKQNPSFPLIADPEKKIYNLYKVQSSVTGMIRGATNIPIFYDTLVREKFKQGKIDGDFFLMPAYFLIAPPKRTIKKAHYGVNFADKTPIITIRDFIEFD